MKHLFLILLRGLCFACSEDDDQDGNNLHPDVEELSTEGISFASPEETLKAIYVMEVKADQMILERRDSGNQKHTIFKRVK